LQRDPAKQGRDCDVFDAGVHSSDVSIGADIEVAGELTSPSGAGVLVEAEQRAIIGASGLTGEELGATSGVEGVVVK